MDYKTYSARLNYLNEMIMKKQAGPSKEIAEKFSCSVRTVKRMMDFLRTNGHAIRYSRKIQKYFLTK